MDEVKQDYYESQAEKDLIRRTSGPRMMTKPVESKPEETNLVTFSLKKKAEFGKFKELDPDVQKRIIMAACQYYGYSTKAIAAYFGVNPGRTWELCNKLGILDEIKRNRKMYKKADRPLQLQHLTELQCEQRESTQKPIEPTIPVQEHQKQCEGCTVHITGVYNVSDLKNRLPWSGKYKVNVELTEVSE